MGYHRAGFEVVGVDIERQPNYPFEFVQADALEYGYECWGMVPDAVHASPPCQAYSTTASLHSNEHPELVEETRKLLQAMQAELGTLYVIENVVGAPLVNPVMLCGSSFGLGARRHRLFEVSPPLVLVPECAHYLQPEPIDVTGLGGPGGRHRKPINLAHAREVMGIDWMTRKELSQSIPPAYTEFIGEHLMSHLKAKANA